MQIHQLSDTNLSSKDLADFLYAIDNDFSPPLSERVKLKSSSGSIHAYSEKLTSQGEVLVCISSDTICGALGFYCNDEKNTTSFISILGVLPNSRGQGIAKALMEKYLAFIASKKYLISKVDTWKDNQAAIHLYTRLGYTVLNEEGFSIKLQKHIPTSTQPHT